MATAAEVAEAIGLSDRAVRKLAEAGVFRHAVHDDTKDNNPWDIGPTVAEAVEDYRKFKERTDDAGKDWRLEVVKEDARVKKLRADKLKLEYDEMLGNYHRAEFVRDAFNALVFAQRAAMAALPGKLAPALAGMDDPAEIAAAIKAEVREIQDDLAHFGFSEDYFRERLVEAGGFAADTDG